MAATMKRSSDQMDQSDQPPSSVKKHATMQEDCSIQPQHGLTISQYKGTLEKRDGMFGFQLNPSFVTVERYDDDYITAYATEDEALGKTFIYKISVAADGRLYTRFPRPVEPPEGHYYM